MKIITLGILLSMILFSHTYATTNVSNFDIKGFKLGSDYPNLNIENDRKVYFKKLYTDDSQVYKYYESKDSWDWGRKP